MRVFDFAAPGSYWLAMIPEVILALTAIVVLLQDAFARPAGGSAGGDVAAGGEDRTGSVDFVLTIAGLASALVGYFWLIGASGPADAIVAVDGLRVAAGFILIVGTLLVVIVSRDYLKREQLRSAEFHALILFALVGMLILSSARDLILLFVALELMSIAVYVLTGYVRRDPRSSEASLKYFITGAFASAFLVYGIALLFGATGTTRLATATDAIAAAAQGGDLLLTAGVGLLLIGFAFKISAVPFHMWAPDAYEGAPTPVTAFMATGVKAAAFIALLRLLTVDLGAAREVWRASVWWLAVLTMIVPNMIALAQESVKRMLAYSSLAHAGYLLVGVVAASALGRAASIFYLAAYTIMTVGSFAILFHVAGKGDERGFVQDFRGLGWKRPGLALALLVFLLSLAGFPLTAGFIGKLYLLRAAVDAGEIGLAVTLVLTSLVAYYYYLRIVWKMYFETAPEGADLPAPPSASFRWAVSLSAVALIAGGLLPGVGIDRAREAMVGRETGAVDFAAPGQTAPASQVATSDRPEEARATFDDSGSLEVRSRASQARYVEHTRGAGRSRPFHRGPYADSRRNLPRVRYPRHRR